MAELEEENKMGVLRHSGTETCVRNAPDTLTIYFSREIRGKLN
jgi:hypothetical protein